MQTTTRTEVYFHSGCSPGLMSASKVLETSDLLQTRSQGGLFDRAYCDDLTVTMHT